MTAVDAWSAEEIEAIVDDYFHMLTQELAGQSYNKTAHRRLLARRLKGRSDSAIERKHQNISATLIALGCPYVAGYKPLGNYQARLFDAVESRLQRDPLFDRAASSAADQPAVLPLVPTLDQLLDELLVQAPTADRRLEDAANPGRSFRYRAGLRAAHRDYLDREARNRSLGEAGEMLVLAYERARLQALGRSRLVDRVEHVSKTRGDGLGFDILSFEENGRERFVEVKTTGFGKETPFYLSRNELEFSKDFPDQFRLCRVFEFRKSPRMFELCGPVESNCLLDPVNYLARFS